MKYILDYFQIHKIFDSSILYAYISDYLGTSELTVKSLFPFSFPP